MSYPEDAPCAGMDGEIFVHEKERTDLTLQALSVCATCPFKTACLKDGQDSGSVGVWGGKWLDLPEEITAEVKKK